MNSINPHPTTPTGWLEPQNGAEFNIRIAKLGPMHWQASVLTGIRHICHPKHAFTKQGAYKAAVRAIRCFLAARDDITEITISAKDL